MPPSRPRRQGSGKDHRAEERPERAVLRPGRSRSSTTSTAISPTSASTAAAGTGSRVLNSNRGKRENISRMFQMHAADRNPIDVAEPATSSPVSASRIRPDRRHALRSRPSDHSGTARRSPSRSSACRSSPRRRPTSRSSAKRSPRSSAKTRPSRPTTTKKPARPSSPAWASCTWKFSACA
jgi:hypothetical protein